MKKHFFLLMALFFLAALNYPISAQVSSDDDCDQLKAVINDANEYFSKYKDDFIDDSGKEKTYAYNLSLWNDEGHYMYYYYEDYDLYYVEYYYPSTYNLDEAQAFYSKLKQKIKDCLSSNFFESANMSHNFKVYTKFSDLRDKDDLEFPLYSEIEIFIKEEDDYYYVMISVLAPEDMWD
jgi:hypothetical protein